MIIFGVDHGTKYTGWAVMRDFAVKNFGINDYTEVEYPKVIESIFCDFSAMFDILRPDVVVVEKPVHFQNAHSTRVLIGAYSAVILAALQNNISIAEIRPDEVKALAGKGNADKWDVAVAVQKRFGLDFDEIAIPLFYQKGPKKGQIRDRLYDPADAIALCWAYVEKTKRSAA